MFGYVIVNKQELKFREFDLYQSYYCGFCQKLKEKYGKIGQLTLSYDTTFLILLLTSLYEPDTTTDGCKCIAHPFENHPTRTNHFTDYATDMNLLLSYYKCEDDWADERKLTKKAMSGMMKGNVKKIQQQYPAKAGTIKDKMLAIQQFEKSGGTDVDQVAGYFGDIMAELFAVRQDEWELDLRRIGFYLGKFIYLMDAYEDLEKDQKEGSFNPFFTISKGDGFEQYCEQILTMMMAECSKSFEKLPIIDHIDILRNILYSGVWCRYEMVKQNRLAKKQKQERASEE